MSFGTREAPTRPDASPIPRDRNVMANEILTAFDMLPDDQARVRLVEVVNSFFAMTPETQAISVAVQRAISESGPRA